MFLPDQHGRYIQMYSSAIAPSLHFATVTMRPTANSPTAHVHSPDPKLMGWDVILDGRATGGRGHGLHGVDVRLNSPGGRLAIDDDEHIVCVIMGEDAVPVSAISTLEVEFVHAFEVPRDVVIAMRGLPF